MFAEECVCMCKPMAIFLMAPSVMGIWTNTHTHIRAEGFREISNSDFLQCYCSPFWIFSKMVYVCIHHVTTFVTFWIFETLRWDPMKTLIALHFNASMIKKQMFFNYQRAYAHTHTHKFSCEEIQPVEERARRWERQWHSAERESELNNTSERGRAEESLWLDWQSIGRVNL